MREDRTARRPRSATSTTARPRGTTTNQACFPFRHLHKKRDLTDCLPRLSSRRESQFGKAKTAYDYCKEVLTYKKDKSLCK